MNPFRFHIPPPPAAESSVPFPHPEHLQQPKERKGKRSKFQRPTTTHFPLGQYNYPNVAESSGAVVSKPMKRPYRKKALRVGGETAAAAAAGGGSSGKVVHPCTECGKRFCSWKALFGHMRCHPERQWRGINPPPDHQHAIPSPTPPTRPEEAPSQVGMEEEEVARCLIMLSCSVHGGTNGGGLRLAPPNGMPPPFGANPPEPARNKAGGTHRQRLCESNDTTNKNLKGSLVKHGDGDEHDEKMYGSNYQQHDHHVRNMAQHHHHHQCNVCMRVFSCGQALGGHMRYHHHWGDEKHHHHHLPPLVLLPPPPPLQNWRNSHLDLNLPAPMDLDDLTDGSSTSVLGLDLKLGTGSTEDRNYSSRTRNKEDGSGQNRPVFGVSTYC